MTVGSRRASPPPSQMRPWEPPCTRVQRGIVRDRAVDPTGPVGSPRTPTWPSKSPPVGLVWQVPTHRAVRRQLRQIS